jgi:hypothetical protein
MAENLRLKLESEEKARLLEEQAENERIRLEEEEKARAEA